MRYTRFALNGSIHYGLVESVAGRQEITRLLTQLRTIAMATSEVFPAAGWSMSTSKKLH